MGTKDMIPQSCHCAVFYLGEKEVAKGKRAPAHRERNSCISSRFCCTYILSPLFPQPGVCASPG